MIALCGLVSLLCAVANVAHVSLLPPGVKARNLDVAAATTRVAVDLPKPLLSDALATDGSYQNLQKRAVLVANLMTSDPALNEIARRAGIPRTKIAANTRVMVNVQPVLLEPDSERRAAQIADTKRPYELEIRPDPTKPTIGVYAQAPSVPEAERLADAAMPGVRAFLENLAQREGADPAAQVRLQQFGKARGEILNGGTAFWIAGLTFVFTFAVTCLLALAVSRLRRRRTGGTGEAHPPAPIALNGLSLIHI